MDSEKLLNKVRHVTGGGMKVKIVGPISLGENAIKAAKNKQ